MPAEHALRKSVTLTDLALVLIESSQFCFPKISDIYVHIRIKRPRNPNFMRSMRLQTLFMRELREIEWVSGCRENSIQNSLPCGAVIWVIDSIITDNECSRITGY
jgi:hypothetical protein